MVQFCYFRQTTQTVIVSLQILGPCTPYQILFPHATVQFLKLLSSFPTLLSSFLTLLSRIIARGNWTVEGGNWTVAQEKEKKQNSTQVI